MAVILVVAIAGLFIVLIASLLPTRHERHKQPTDAHILHNQVTHARLLPTRSAHAFTYPTLFLLLPIRALEAHALDLGCGWVFGYGGVSWRLTGLRPQGYLMPDARSVHAKLVELLEQHGHDARLFRDAWMMTMPSYCGLEGINPLTVYFCYGDGAALWMVVLEIHNTFDERHIHFLEVGVNEDPPPKGFDHQWTFPRQFHVSPFNDRSGFYTVALTTPSHAPIPVSAAGLSQPAPRPVIRIHLHVPDPLCPSTPGPLKLTALLRPSVSEPLTTTSLLRALAHQPLVLFLSFARIVFQAGVLHYRRRLRVNVRPDPVPAQRGWGIREGDDAEQPLSGGVKWQSEGILERYARGRVEAFLRGRARATGVSVTLVSANPFLPPSVFLPSRKEDSTAEKIGQSLTVWYRSPQFFTTVFVAPSAAHAIQLGTTEGLFTFSSRELFTLVFSPPYAQTSQTLCQRLRAQAVPQVSRYAIPQTHPLDMAESAVIDSAMLAVMLTSGKVEEWAYRMIGTRFVRGQEPWKRWQRALERKEVASKSAN
ncbi:hypothetical protein BKA93DRAFT_724674 [Sparassis latifolia]